MMVLIVALAAASLVGAVFLLVASFAVRRFVRWPATIARDDVPVTILKPLHGKDAQLYENLRSLCDQRYRYYQIVFGVHDADDPAIPVVKRLIAEFPDKDLALVVNPSVAGNNFKV